MSLLRLVGLSLGAVRAVYPSWLEVRQARRHPTGPDGIIAGAGAIDLEAAGSDRAVLLIHGCGDSPQVMAGLAKHMHSRGFSVRAPLLAHHGRAVEEMHRYAFAEWREQVRGELDALRARHAWVGVAGISMGGALALGLAVERPDIPALVIFAPWVEMPEVYRLLARTSHHWSILAPYLPSLGADSIHDPIAAREALSHGMVTPASLRALHVAADLAQSALPQVRTPTLVMQSRQDNRVSVGAADAAFAKLGAPDKRFVWLDDAGHVITVDFGKERVFSLTSEWMESHRGA